MERCTPTSTPAKVPDCLSPFQTSSTSTIPSLEYQSHPQSKSSVCSNQNPRFQTLATPHRHHDKHCRRNWMGTSEKRSCNCLRRFFGPGVWIRDILAHCSRSALGHAQGICAHGRAGADVNAQGAGQVGRVLVEAKG